jgi:hypothetical protein
MRMNRRAWLMLGALPVLSAGLRGGLAQAPAHRTLSWSREEIETFLRTAEVTDLRTLSTGITRSRRATLNDGVVTHDAHVQTIDKFRMVYETSRGTYLNFTDTYEHNIAGYLLDRMLDLRMVPVSVERKVRAETAAVTWWVDDVLMSERQRFEQDIEPPDMDYWNRQIYCVRVFDELICNIDRNLGNLLITNDWTVWMIDHTRAFRPDKRLKNPDNLVRCDRRLFAALKNLTTRGVERELGRYIDGMRVSGLLARRDRIVEFFEDEARQKGDMAVFYDYLPRPEKIEFRVSESDGAN